jgi:hypothetical protein
MSPVEGADRNLAEQYRSASRVSKLFAQRDS